MDWFTDLPVWMRYGAALGLLGVAFGLQMATNQRPAGPGVGGGDGSR